MYEDEDDQDEGPKSSFVTYLSEGDGLFKQGEHKKALESYTLALEQQPGDKNGLVARSKCHLQLGDTEKALADAEESLVEDQQFHKGLYHKAEALYAGGNFEQALVFYHRGHKIRPELQVFRLGIQKAQEAIDNAIGEPAGIKLENKGDLSFFQKQDDLKKSKGYKMKPKPQRTQPQQTTKGKPPPEKKSVKRAKALLGELYDDKVFLEGFLEEFKTAHASDDQGRSQQNQHDNDIYGTVYEAIQFLENRIDFWGQQKPLYARQKGKVKSRKQFKDSGKNADYILQALEEIDRKLVDGDAEGSLKQAEETLKKVRACDEKDLKGKQDILGNLHSCIGNACLEMDNIGKALDHHKKDLSISKKIDSSDGKSRSLDNLGRCYAKQGDFAQAIDCWMDKIKMCKTALETTWLYHEIGRCHLEMKNYQDAKEFGEESFKAAVEAEDQTWQLNATVLISQANVKMGELDESLKSFQKALELAKLLEDDPAEGAISKAIADVENRLAQEQTESSKEENDKEEPPGDRMTAEESEVEAKPENDQVKEEEETAHEPKSKEASDTEQEQDKEQTEESAEKNEDDKE